MGFLNLTNWLGNVILPTLSGLMLALAVWNFSRGREVSHLTWSAFAALAVSGLLREFETFASLLAYNNPDLVWNALLNLVNWFASVLQADIVIPESCIKPELRWSPIKLIQNLVSDGVRFQGRAVLGIRDWSRNLEFKSSYTLVEHAPIDSITSEIIPQAIEQVDQLVDAALRGDYEQLFELLGSSPCQSEEEELEGFEYTSYENSVAEAALKADGSGGYLVKHPYVRQRLSIMLARWTFKMCTSGGFRMPAFALADDGFLFLAGGKIISGSDWIPHEGTIVDASDDRGLVVRYPIRMKEDLLPVRRIPSAALGTIFEQTARKQGAALATEEASAILESQICLPGTLVLHSQTAKQNGGDFDFDLVAFLGAERFPKFVQSRFEVSAPFVVTKDKRERQKTPYFNFCRIAMKAKGNDIGRITDLKTSCLAAGRRDLAYKLVKELQSALDALKHGTKVDRELIRAVRNEIPTPAWLHQKRATSVAEFPAAIDAADADVIGQIYNCVRPHIENLFTAVLPLGDFAGLITGHLYTKEMAEECRQVNRMYAGVVRRHKQEEQEHQATYGRARAAVEEAKANLGALGQNPSQQAKEAAYRTRNAAYAQLKRVSKAKHNAEERRKEERKRLTAWIRLWGASKRSNRLGWCQALHDRTQKSTFEGVTASLLFLAFPQEVVDSIVEATGGRPVMLRVPEQPDGEILLDADGNVFRVEPYEDASGRTGEKHVFLFRITEGGKVISSAGHLISRVQPFAIEESKGEIRNGQVILSGITQKPSVKGIAQNCIPTEEGNSVTAR